MIKYIDADGVEHDVFITDNNYRPGQLADENGVISNYYTNTVSGTDGIVMEHTYNDKIDLLKIYGKSVQDGTPSPDNPIAIQSVGGTLTITDGDGGQAVTMEIPTLYGVGDVSDVLYVDRAQGRAWVERNFVKIEPTQIRGVYNLNVYDITQCFVVTGSNMRPRNDNSTISGLCNYLEYVGKGLNVNTFYRDETIAFMHWSALNIFYIKIPYENLGVERGVDGTTMKEAGSNWLASCNPPFVFLTEANTAQIEELDYVALPTFPKNTIISVDSAVAPVVEATVKGYLADDYNNVTATALIALGVESSADQAENLEMLTELGVNPYE